MSPASCEAVDVDAVTSLVPHRPCPRWLDALGVSPAVLTFGFFQVAFF